MSRQPGALRGAGGAGGGELGYENGVSSRCGMAGIAVAGSFRLRAAGNAGG